MLKCMNYLPVDWKYQRAYAQPDLGFSLGKGRGGEGMGDAGTDAAGDAAEVGWKQRRLREVRPPRWAVVPVLSASPQHLLAGPG